MANLVPYGRIVLASVRDAYGAVDYQSDSLAWRLPQSLGTAGVFCSGLIADPTGDYAIQEPRYTPLDADEKQWLSVPALTAHHGHGQDVQTGKKTLRQINGAADVKFDITFQGEQRAPDVGFRLRLFRGAPVFGNTNTDGSVADAPDAANYNFYVHFSGDPFQPGYDTGFHRRGPIRAGEGEGSGGPVLRLAVEHGRPLRLEVSLDAGGSWNTVDTADALGASETYLRKAGVLDIDVCPLTDASWYDDLPYSAQYSGPPPNLVAVTIGGGDGNDTLVYRAEGATLTPGAVRLAGQGGQWQASYWQRRYAPSAGLELPPQARPRPFQTELIGGILGYAPLAEWGTVSGILTDANKAYATLDVEAGRANLDPAGIGAYQTVALSAVHLTFPAVQIPPSGGAETLTLECFEFEDRHTFQQADFLGRANGYVLVADPDGQFAPGAGLPVAVQAAQLFRGLADAEIGYDDGAVAITGLAAVGEDDLTWELHNSVRYVKIPLSDRFRDNVSCGFMLPMDGQCHYYAMRELAHRMGVTDDWLNFPLCDRDSACPHYHLPQGTAQEPAFRFLPVMTVVAAMLRVRAASGEPDFQTDVVCPMYLYFDHDGFLQYFPAPVGLVQTWLDPSLTPQSQSITLQKVFQRQPTFDGPFPNLDEFLGTGPLTSRASLKNIRTDIVLQGIRPSDGALLDAWFTNPALASGPTVNGSVGLAIAYIETSKRFTSPEALNVALQAAAVQMSFPSATTTFMAHLQSRLFALTPIGILDAGTQGTSGVVPYYTEDVTNHGRSDGVEWCRIQARLLGQAGD